MTLQGCEITFVGNVKIAEYTVPEHGANFIIIILLD